MELAHNDMVSSPAPDDGMTIRELAKFLKANNLKKHEGNENAKGKGSGERTKSGYR